MEINPIATIEMKKGGKIVIELYPKEAPNTVNSFIYLANRGKFDNRSIKRIVKDFVLQPSYTSFEDEECDFSLEGEFRENGFDNNLKLSKWSVAMGGDGKEIASGSCFFIAVGNREDKLDGKYAGFGRVIGGFEEIERILSVETKSIDVGIQGVEVNQPVDPEVMKKVSVETFGVTYGDPKKLSKQL